MNDPTLPGMMDQDGYYLDGFYQNPNFFARVWVALLLTMLAGALLLALRTEIRIIKGRETSRFARWQRALAISTLIPFFLISCDSERRVTAEAAANGPVITGINQAITGTTYEYEGLPEGTHYYHVNHLGSSSVITDETGRQVTRINYNPYGEIVQDRSDGKNSVTEKFTGQELDEEMDLYYYGARYYDPFTGRFLRADTIVPDPLDSQAYNRYMYVNGNPINYVDPTGHFGIAAAIIVGAVIGAYSAHQASDGDMDATIKGAIIGGVAGAAGAGVGAWAMSAGYGVVGSGMMGGMAGGAAGGSLGSALHGGSRMDILKAGTQGAALGAMSGGIGGAITAATNGFVAGSTANAGGAYMSGYAQGGESAGWESARYAFAGGVLSAGLFMSGVGADGWTGTDEYNQFIKNNPDTSYVLGPKIESVGDLFWALIGLTGDGSSHTQNTNDTENILATGRPYRIVQTGVADPTGESYYVNPPPGSVGTGKGHGGNYHFFKNNCTTRFGFGSPAGYSAHYKYQGQGAYWWARTAQ